MSDNTFDIYTTYVNYERSELDIHAIADYEAMQTIADQNFEMNKRRLGDVLTNQKFKVPEYQRLFSWRTRNHRQLWSDIQEFVDADLNSGSDNVSDVFFSTVYFAANEESLTYEIIDGQQRLTSIHILLRVILERLQELHMANEFDERTITALCGNSIQQIKSILYDLSRVVVKKPRLSLNKHDDAFFRALISGPKAQLKYLCSDDRPNIDGRRGEATRIQKMLDEFDIDEEVIENENPNRDKFSEFIPVHSSHWRLLDAYQFYQERVGEVVDNCERADGRALALLNLSNYIQQSYYVGEFVIREAEPNFRMQIFEILNDRGLELSKIDRIRATVVNAFFDEDDKDEYVGKWEEIVLAFGTKSKDIDDYLSVYLSIVDEDIETVGQASGELTNAFSTRNIDTEIDPRFDNLNEARSFLDEARTYVDYYNDITTARLEHGDLAEFKDHCEEILVRLNRLRTEQWYPLALELYRHAATEGSEERFYRTLETIETLNLRRLLVGVNPNIFQMIFIEAVHEFSTAVAADDIDPYERVRQYLITEMKPTAPDLFGDRFLDTLTERRSWDPNLAKLLLGKMANQWFREEGYTVDRTLNMGNIHLEHVFPQSLVHDQSNPIWLSEFFDLEGSDVKIATEIRQYIDLVQASDENLDDDAIRRRANIEDFITNRFIEDIGNYVLLSDGDNIRASNRPLAEKIPQYYNNEEDFTIIRPNRYFTPTNPAFKAEHLDALRSQVELVDNGDREFVDPKLIEYFNSFWTYEAMQERRVDLLLDVFETLSFDEFDEFGMESDRQTVGERVRAQTEAEFEKRLSLRSL